MEETNAYVTQLLTVDGHSESVDTLKILEVHKFAGILYASEYRDKNGPRRPKK